MAYIVADAGIRTVFGEFFSRRISAPVALARFLLYVESPARLEEVLRAERLAADRSGSALAGPIGTLQELFDQNRAGTQITQLLIQRHEEPDATPDRVEKWRRFFDEGASISEEASVAAYSLGNPNVLARATAEIVDLFGTQELLGPEISILEIGCGIGRIAHAFSPRVKRFHGTDVSPNMLVAARRRCAGLPNLSFSLSSGRELDSLSDRSFDVVAIVDSFPYIHDAGMELVATHFDGVGRILKDSGEFVILNFTYGGDLGAERRELRWWAENHGFEVLVDGERPFRLWDGTFYRLKKKTGPGLDPPRTAMRRSRRRTPRGPSR